MTLSKKTIGFTIAILSVFFVAACDIPLLNGGYNTPIDDDIGGGDGHSH